MSKLSAIWDHVSLGIEMDQAQRLFHGRGHAYDGFHHVTLDWLTPVALITLFAPEPREDVVSFARQLMEKLPPCECVLLQHRYEKEGPMEVIAGREISELAITEGRLKYWLQLGHARNTGLFLDMKNGRDWVLNHSANRRVLNLFAYTCGFSVAAIAGGASAVVNVDLSRPALSVGRKNHQLNGQALAKVAFEKVDILKSFGRLRKRGPFDLLICDPPTFQKGSVDIARDYARILRRLDEFMAPSATLMLCLNAPHLSREFLVDEVARWAPRYILENEVQPPAIFAEAERKGLKVLIFEKSGPSPA